MAKISFSKARNPISETYVCHPEGKDPITFTLKPIDTNISLSVYSFLNSDPTDRPARMVGIAASRISSWEGVMDENGTEVPFSEKNLGLFVSLFEAMAYLMDIAHHTVNSVLGDKPEKKPELPSETKSETLNEE